MILKEFRNQLNKTGKINLIIKYKRPHIKNDFIEKYLFKKSGSNIESYENGEKLFETDSISHMYFIYRKVLRFKKRIKNRRNNKPIKEL